MKKVNLVSGLIGFGVGLVVVYATIYVAGRGWKKSQKQSNDGFLNIEGVASSGICRRLNEDGSYTTYTAQGDIRPCPSGGVHIPHKERKSVSLTM
jgi:hypothetical protein